MSKIPCQRDRFSIPPDVHYLNCAYMAPLSHDVADAMERGARRKQAPWTIRPSDFFTLCEDFRARAGRLAEVDPDRIAIVPSVSYALSVAARNLPLARGQAIVTLADQFPSNVYPWRALAAANGGQIKTVQRDPGSCWTEAVLDAIGDDTAIVAVPNCHWADGRIVDLISVGEKCRAHGAALVLDLTQSLGAMPIDFAAVRPDFAVAACYKWLMGPYGLAMLYVDPRHHGGEPIEHNWINRGGSEDFSRLVDYRDDYQPGARRFDMGEKSNPVLLEGASAALDYLLALGVANISNCLLKETELIAACATRIGLSAPDTQTRAAHFLSLGFPDGAPNGLTDLLAERRIHVSLRGQSLRVTPHVYNTPDDREALLSALQSS